MVNACLRCQRALLRLKCGIDNSVSDVESRMSRMSRSNVPDTQIDSLEEFRRIADDPAIERIATELKSCELLIESPVFWNDRNVDNGQRELSLGHFEHSWYCEEKLAFNCELGERASHRGCQPFS